MPFENCGPARLPGELRISVADVDQLDDVRGLWREYWQSLALPPDFQGFAGELATLPGRYVSPGGRLLLARIDGVPAGTAAFRPLRESACEAKRLYISPRFRGFGAGRLLLERLLLEARGEGYREMYADTLKSMTAALGMYRAMGFLEVAPYSPDPTPDAIFLRADLMKVDLLRPDLLKVDPRA